MTTLNTDAMRDKAWTLLESASAGNYTNRKVPETLIRAAREIRKLAMDIDMLDLAD